MRRISVWLSFSLCAAGVLTAMADAAQTEHPDVRNGSRAVKLAMSIFLLKCPGLRTLVASVANPILLRPAFWCRERQLRCDLSSHTG